MAVKIVLRLKNEHILIFQAFQCCSFSPCGRFIASSTADGYLIVWDAETQECLRKYVKFWCSSSHIQTSKHNLVFSWQHPLRSSICSLMWDPRENNSLALSDVRGQVGVMVDVISTEQPTKQASKLEVRQLLGFVFNENLLRRLELDRPILLYRGFENWFERDVNEE